MRSEFCIAGYSIYWKFPTSVERLACVVQMNELWRLAYQEDTEEIYVLIAVTPTWVAVGSGGSFEPTITAGTTSQYWRGDKTWQTLDKSAVGLSNVDNTSDANKPVSTAQATAIALKEPAITAGTNAQFWRGDKTWQDLFTEVRSAVLTGLSTASGTVVTASHTVLQAIGFLQKQVSDNTTSISGKEPSITAGTTAQYWRGDKSWQTLDKSAVGLGNVDNTADTAKPVSTAQQAALDLKGDLGPAFSVYQTSASSLTGSVNTKVLFDTEEFDTAGCFASSRFTPNKAGNYNLVAIVTMGAAVAQVIVCIFKNGSLFKQGPNNSGGQNGSGVFGLVNMNGTTDYVEIYTYQNSSTQNTAAGQSQTFFYGNYIPT